MSTVAVCVQTVMCSTFICHWQTSLVHQKSNLSQIWFWEQKPSVYPWAMFANRNQTCQWRHIIDPTEPEPMFRLAALSQIGAQCPFFPEKKKKMPVEWICIQNAARSMVCSIAKGHRDSNEVPAGKITSPLWPDRHLPLLEQVSCSRMETLQHDDEATWRTLFVLLPHLFLTVEHYPKNGANVEGHLNYSAHTHKVRST